MQDKNAFLFTLANPSGAVPTKLSQTNSTVGIRYNPNTGPQFGNVNSSCINFMSNGSSTCSISNTADFSLPAGQQLPNFICGTTSISMSYLEVYALTEC